MALDSGFTSVNVRWLTNSLCSTNIAATLNESLKMAHEAGISCEGEIGFVGYSNGGENSSGYRSCRKPCNFCPRQLALMRWPFQCWQCAFAGQDKEGGLDEDRICCHSDAYGRPFRDSRWLRCASTEQRSNASHVKLLISVSLTLERSCVWRSVRRVA